MFRPCFRLAFPPARKNRFLLKRKQILTHFVTSFRNLFCLSSAECAARAQKKTAQPQLNRNEKKFLVSFRLQALYGAAGLLTALLCRLPGF